MYILCAKECKCDIADWDWEGYIGTARVHSLAGTKMRDRQISGKFTLRISDIIRTVHTLGRP